MAVDVRLMMDAAIKAATVAARVRIMVRMRMVGCGGWRPPVSGSVSSGIGNTGAGGSCGACSAVIAMAAFMGRAVVLAQTMRPSTVMIKLDARMVRFPSPCSSCAMLTSAIVDLSSSGNGKHILAGFSSRYALRGCPDLSTG